MISEESKRKIAELFQMKEMQLKQPIPPENLAEATLAVREGFAAFMQSLPIPKTVTAETVEQEKFHGEYVTYHGTDRKEGHVILLFYGGGFANGSVASRRFLCSKLADTAKMDALSVAYSQWPEAMHPTALHEAVAAYQWLISHGTRPDKIHFFGESAGAIMAVTLGLYLKDHDMALPDSICAVSIPAVIGKHNLNLPSRTERDARDPMLIGGQAMDMLYFTEEDTKSPYVSCAYGNFQGFPRLLLHVGSEEILHDDTIYIYHKAQEAGVDVTMKEWDGMFHSFCVFDLPETAAECKEIAEFFWNSQA